jgi:alanine dehydrogenase
MMAYGERTGLFHLKRVYRQKSFKDLIHTYFGLRLPNVKVVVTGSGRVAHGIIEIMNLMGIREVEPDEYLERRFSYPVFTQLKSAHLYRHKTTGAYNRSHFHQHPQEYESVFLPYTTQTDILMNGVYWEQHIPRLFEKEEAKKDSFIIQTIADITDDFNGSVPVNMGDATIENPVYGIDKTSLLQTAPYLQHGIDIMAVGNLPNELPRDASSYFGEQLIKFVLDDLIKGGSPLLEKATIVKNGKINTGYEYMADYAI